MITQTYVAATMGEAMRKVARELGEDAIIVSTRQLRGRRDGSHGFSVTASLDRSNRSSCSPRPNRSGSERPVMQPNPLSVQGHSPDPLHSLAPSLESSPESGEMEARVRALEAELKATRSANEQLTRDADLHASLLHELGAIGRAVSRMGSDEEAVLLDPEIRELVECGIDLEIARSLAERARGRSDIDPKAGFDLMTELACAIPVAPPLWSGSGRKMALIGSNGAGKTSTIAKIAAEASCGRGLSVGIISVDALRPGRSEQVACIAEDLGLPFVIATNRAELEEGIACFEGMDLTLVDTWGLNPWRAEERDALDALLSGMALEKHLVVSGTWRPSELRALIARQEGIDSLVVTKVDEARGPSVVLAATWNSGYAVSHVCTGPEFLGDIVAADGVEIARQIMARAA